ncbi:MAG: N-acyl homoserine lactonase family protein [Acetobacteraceae bacterium]
MFIDGDPHDGPMPMNYYVWVLRSADRVFVVDIGFTEEVAKRRGRTFLRCPAETLGMLGIDANAVNDVILTHLHNDHAGNYAKFPNARFHLQEAEMAYVTGKYMRYPCCGRAYEPEEVVGMVRMNFQGRIEFYDGDAELADGISIHRTGGHTAGLQFVRVRTRRGWLVLASDASHYYENLRDRRPFRLAFHVGQMLDAFRALERQATSSDHIIPGHDPLVMERYQPPTPEMPASSPARLTAGAGWEGTMKRTEKEAPASLGRRTLLGAAAAALPALALPGHRPDDGPGEGTGLLLTRRQPRHGLAHQDHRAVREEVRLPRRVHRQ